MNVREADNRSKFILWQRPMTVVLLGTIPCVASGVYFFGIRALAVIAVSIVSAVITEWLFARTQGKPVTSAVFVTAVLLALSLPPTLPLWMAAVGACAAIAFGKMMLGGFGRNVFNPALVGRCFIYICFPVHMTARFLEPATDAITSATPLSLWRDLTRAYDYNVSDLFLGNIGGCIGETCAIAILAGCIILLVARVANWRIILAVLIGAIVTSVTGHYLGADRIPDPIFTLGSGGLLFAAVFMATDPVSAPTRKASRWICGLGIGALTVILRSYSIFAGGVMFAVLLVNMFTPSIDMLVRAIEDRRKRQDQ